MVIGAARQSPPSDQKWSAMTKWGGDRSARDPGVLVGIGWLFVGLFVLGMVFVAIAAVDPILSCTNAPIVDGELPDCDWIFDMRGGAALIGLAAMPLVVFFGYRRSWWTVVIGAAVLWTQIGLGMYLLLSDASTRW